ncbi:MAG: hypothetical protein HGB34_03020 [Candidatus Moranbacteria bacterium]|nr:hypothetical protein [Candidatus Moranbacteria bacterium]
MSATTNAVVAGVFSVRIASGTGVGIEPIVPIGFIFVAISAAVLRWDVRYLIAESLPRSINIGVSLVHGATCVFLTAGILTEFRGILSGSDGDHFWIWLMVAFIGVSAHGMRDISKGLSAKSAS